jgi:hypothetical protein
VFKRLLWLTIGVGIGVGFSFWVLRFIRTTVARYTPERVSANLAAAVEGLGNDLRAAVAEGRQAMREREIELRRELSRP